MLKSRCVSVLLIVLAMQFLDASVVAQLKGRTYGGAPRNVLNILSSPSAVKELKVGGPAVAKLEQLTAAYRKDNAIYLDDSLFDLPEPERTKKTAEARIVLHKKHREIYESYILKAKALLTPGQLERAQQIAWQTQGSGAFSEPEAVAALELTKPQQEQIAAANKDYDVKLKGLFAAVSGNQIIDLKKKAKYDRERDSGIMATLTQEQSEKWTKLIGQPYDLSKLKDEVVPIYGLPEEGEPTSKKK